MWLLDYYIINTNDKFIMKATLILSIAVCALIDCDSTQVAAVKVHQHNSATVGEKQASKEAQAQHN